MVTFSVLKPDKLSIGILVLLKVPKNIPDISDTLAVINDDTFKDSRLGKYANISCILVTSPVYKRSSPFIVLRFVNPLKSSELFSASFIRTGLSSES